jgi:hypothetical protein
VQLGLVSYMSLTKHWLLFFKKKIGCDFCFLEILDCYRSPSRGRPWLRARTLRQYLRGVEGRAGGGNVSGSRDREGGSRRASGERGRARYPLPRSASAEARRESGDGSHSYRLVWPSAHLGEQRVHGSRISMRLRLDLSIPWLKDKHVFDFF